MRGRREGGRRGRGEGGRKGEGVRRGRGRLTGGQGLAEQGWGRQTRPPPLLSRAAKPTPRRVGHRRRMGEREGKGGGGRLTRPLRMMMKPESPRLAAWTVPWPMVRMQAVQDPAKTHTKGEEGDQGAFSRPGGVLQSCCCRRLRELKDGAPLPPVIGLLPLQHSTAQRSTAQHGVKGEGRGGAAGWARTLYLCVLVRVLEDLEGRRGCHRLLLLHRLKAVPHQRAGVHPGVDADLCLKEATSSRELQPPADTLPLGFRRGRGEGGGGGGGTGEGEGGGGEGGERERERGEEALRTHPPTPSATPRDLPLLHT